MKNSLNLMLTQTGVLLTMLLTSVLSLTFANTAANEPLNQAAEQYVRLGLELGQYDRDYVDAYLGPKEWQEQASTPRSKAQLAADISALKKRLAAMKIEQPELLVRHKALSRNVRAMDTRARMVNGERFSFQEEARLIYDVTLPTFDFNKYDQALHKIDQLLTGPGDLASRVDTFRARFDIPAQRLEKVISTAINECRARTKAFITMPERESFTLEYVTDKSWSGYNWYQGNNVSLMQINQDFPTKIDNAVGLGCHEGYPGHHVWNVLIEEELIKANGWVEFNLYPLFSPYGLIAEGSAEYGVSLAFPENEKADYENTVLYPLAGIQNQEADLLATLNTLLKELRYARIAIAQLYLDGDINREEAVNRTIKYSLVSKERADSSIKFIEQYRAYVLNYSIGEDLIKTYIARHSQTHEQRWAAFKQLLTELSTASDLTK